jgi:type I restriction enzyme S subunit
MELKPGYKQTEVGVIPEDWNACKLGRLLQFQNGRGFQQGEWSRTGLPIIRIQNLNDSEAEFNFFNGHIEERHLVQPGDLLFAWSGTVGSSFGPRIWRGETGVLNQHIFKVSPFSKTLSSPYALRLLESSASNIASQSHGFKASFVHVKKRDLEKIVAAFPPCQKEQKRICEALAGIDAYLDATEVEVNKKRDIKQAAMQELLSGKRRLPGFEGEWEVKRLGVLCSMKSGEGITAKSIDAVSPFPCYGGNGLRGFTSRFTHEGDYCLIGRVGALCGNLLKVTGQFFASEHAIVVSAFDNVDVTWLTLALGMLNLNRRAESSAQPVLTVSKLERIEVDVPSTKQEQTAIAAVLSEMDAELAALEVRRDKTRELKRGMMQELLTGRIRLK